MSRRANSLSSSAAHGGFCDNGEGRIKRLLIRSGLKLPFKQKPLCSVKYMSLKNIYIQNSFKTHTKEAEGIGGAIDSYSLRRAK